MIIYVPAETADGLVLVPFTPEEYARLVEGWEPCFEALED